MWFDYLGMRWAASETLEPNWKTVITFVVEPSFRNGWKELHAVVAEVVTDMTSIVSSSLLELSPC